MKTPILLLASFLLAGPAFAGEIVGNGGDVIVCPDKAPVLLDFFEAGALHGLTRRADITGETPEAIAKNALRDLLKLNPTRARLYAARIDRFMQEASLVPHAELADIPDSDPMALPNGCKLRQLAIQKPKMLPQDPLYVIDQDIWDTMAPEQKAGLMVHEVVYTDAIRWGQKNSRYVRYLTALIHSSRLEKTSVEDFNEFIRSKMYLFNVVELGVNGLVAMNLLESPDANWAEGRDDSKLQRISCSYIGMKPVTYQEVQSSLKKLMQIHSSRIKEEISGEFGFVYALYSTAAKKVYGYFVNKTELTEEDDASRAVHTLCKP